MALAARKAYPITFTEFAIAFSAFAFLLGFALIAAEPAEDLGFSRTVYTIWATTALVTPALCAFALPGDSTTKRNVWLLFWTFSFCAYVVHMLYAVLAAYHGSFQEFLAGQGVFPAIVNVVFTLWWALDVALAWFGNDAARWVRVQRIAVHIFIGLTFFASTVILKHGFINVLGIAMTASMLICLMIRFDAKRRGTAS